MVLSKSACVRRQQVPGNTYLQHMALLFLKSMEPDCNLPALAADGRTYSRRLLQGGDFPVLGDTV